MYKLTHDDIVIRTADGARIPMVAGNIDYVAFLTWVQDGNTPVPADPVAAPIVAVSPWQIRKALNTAGLRASVEAAVAASDQTTKDAWEFAQEFRRDNPLIASVASALGKTDAEIDTVFDLAQTL